MLDELGALISMLQMVDDAMTIETLYSQVQGEKINIKVELSNHELVDAALGINHALKALI